MDESLIATWAVSVVVFFSAALAILLVRYLVKHPKAVVDRGGVLYTLGELSKIATIRTWAMFAAGPFLLLFAVWLVVLIRYNWPVVQASRQLDILGKALWMVLGLNGVIIVALASARVVGRSGNASVEISSDSPPPAPAPQVTVTTEVKPGA